MTDKKPDSKPVKNMDETRKPAIHEDQNKELAGPMSNDAVHKTESKDHHPMGKTKHGGRSK
ncbi:MAG: hypothetical protein ABJB66_02415 [Gemmatimonadaceae bacterium]